MKEELDSVTVKCPRKLKEALERLAEKRIYERFRIAEEGRRNNPP